MATWHEKTQRWMSSKTVNGKRLWFTSRISEEDADRQAREAQTLGPTFEASTFAAFVYGAWKANTWPELRYKSQVKYNGQLKNHILPILGDLPIASIGLEEMVALKGSLVLRGHKTPGEPMANRTAHAILTLTLGIMEMARSAGKTQREDWRLVKLPKYEKKKDREEPPENLNDLLTVDHWMRGPLFAALCLGLREGEVCGLKWSAIDRKRLTITIKEQRQRQKGKGTVDVPTKGKPRVLEVNEELIAWLDTLGCKDSIYVFTYRSGIPMRPDKITQVMPTICKKVGLPKMTFHDLRSYAGWNLAALGVDGLTIMNILGHTKIDTTLLYLGTKKANIRKALATLLSGMEKTG